MAIPRTSRGLSLAQQALGLRVCFPEAKIILAPTRLIWIGLIRPTPCSRDYRIKITYRYLCFPDVVAITPLESRPGENLPHTYGDGSLCLHETHEWTPSMAIADTIVPWTSEWLAHYELWKVRGRWYGDDQEHHPVDPVQLPSGATHNQTDRRREHRFREYDATTQAAQHRGHDRDRVRDGHRSQWETP